MTVSVEIAVEAAGWKDAPRAASAVRGAIGAALAGAEFGACEIGVVLTDDERIRSLNRAWRGKDGATNVLSFPAPAGPQEGPRFLGDVVFALETIRREADDEQKTFEDHLTHLAVHGVLHLLGFDHEREDDAEAMESRERKILAGLGIADPYEPAKLKRTEPA